MVDHASIVGPIGRIVNKYRRSAPLRESSGPCVITLQKKGAWMERESAGERAGIIVIWNDIVEESRADFLEWHSREHIPERVAIPGFVRGQRWFDPASSPQYLTVYSTRDTAVLTSAPYLERLNNPTSWTRSAVAAFRNTSRSAGSLAWDSQGGNGGTMLTARISEPVDAADQLVKGWATHLLGPLASAAGVARVRVAVSAAAASRLATAERAVRVGDLAEPPVTLLVEGFGTPAALRAAYDALAAGDPVLARARVDVYTLQFDLAR